ncbi:hypothetical protein CRENBAI_022665 [Crenichthys baileyi]|uniref:Uncharacterized protein n=1 Tax=Crenichthys baileyi TaxID=28760 RepID=A0AAV9RD83_9TELE
MKGQFIRSCSGRQNILPQCFTDCLDEKWERISAVLGLGSGRSSWKLAQPAEKSPFRVKGLGYTGREEAGYGNGQREGKKTCSKELELGIRTTDGCVKD